MFLHCKFCSTPLVKFSIPKVTFRVPRRCFYLPDRGWKVLELGGEGLEANYGHGCSSLRDFFSSLPMHLFTFQYLGSAWAQGLFPSTSHHDFYPIRISPYIPWHHHPFLCPQVGRAMCWLSVSNRTINF